MSKLYNELVEGFNEILDSHANNNPLKTTTIEIPDVKQYSNSEIRNIRNNAGLTQTLFARYMGVSKKTVEAWEHGTNKPTGPACRLLSLIEAGRNII